MLLTIENVRLRSAEDLLTFVPEQEEAVTSHPHDGTYVRGVRTIFSH